MYLASFFRIVALRSVGQLAPAPDLTRQCAFDLRS